MLLSSRLRFKMRELRTIIKWRKIRINLCAHSLLNTKRSLLLFRTQQSLLWLENLSFLILIQHACGALELRSWLLTSVGKVGAMGKLSRSGGVLLGVVDHIFQRFTISFRLLYFLQVGYLVRVFLFFVLFLNFFCSHFLNFLFSLFVSLVYGLLAISLPERGGSFLSLILFFVSFQDLIFELLVLDLDNLCLNFLLLNLDKQSGVGRRIISATRFGTKRLRSARPVGKMSERIGEGASLHFSRPQISALWPS